MGGLRLSLVAPMAVMITKDRSGAEVVTRYAGMLGYRPGGKDRRRAVARTARDTEVDPSGNGRGCDERTLDRGRGTRGKEIER